MFGATQKIDQQLLTCHHHNESDLFVCWLGMSLYIISNMFHYFHVWVFGLLKANRGVVCANNRYVAFAFVFAWLKLVDTIVWTHVGHESGHVPSICQCRMCC